MKVCPNCKFVGNENEAYCMKCGTPLVEQNEPSQEAPQTTSYIPYGAPQTGEEISLGKWILYHLIPYIPFVGSLIYLIMLFVWGFDQSKNKTFRNWARAQLIFTAVGFGIALVFFVIIFVILGHTFADVVHEFMFY